MKYRVSLFGRKISSKSSAYTMLPWQEVEAKSHDDAIAITSSILKDTHEYLDFGRSELIKLPTLYPDSLSARYDGDGKSTTPFMKMPGLSFSVGYE